MAALGGLHRFTGWTGHTLTDSGGYQVHSLKPAVDDDGVTFTSVYDGERVRLTPESAVVAQGLIGADIQMVLDVCATLPAPTEALRVAVDRTAVWAGRVAECHRQLEAKPDGQALFGIVRGASIRCCAQRVRNGRWRSGSTATASVVCRWVSHDRRCLTLSVRPCPISLPTRSAT